jgi:hypothetical protein
MRGDLLADGEEIWTPEMVKQRLDQVTVGWLARCERPSGGIKRRGSDGELNIPEIRASIISETGWTLDEVQACPFPIRSGTV